MNDLDNVAVVIPIGEAEKYGSYFWYAIWNADPAHAKVFKAAPVGTWVNRGDPVYSLKDGSASVRSPVSGVVVANEFSNLIIQPVRGYTLSQYDGEFVFGEIISLIHTIEETVANQANGGCGCLGLIFGIGEKYPSVRKKTPEERAKFLAGVNKLAEVQCSTRSLKS